MDSRHRRRARDRGRLGSPGARRALAQLHERPVNFSEIDPVGRTAHGWTYEEFRQPLPPEPPGAPVPHGSWEIAKRLVRDYEFADPRIVRAVYYPDVPLADRDMLLVGRFFGLRFHLGVRVGGVVDEVREVDGQPVRIWGWDYKTLQGHLEAGQMDYEVWKWLRSGQVEFRIRRLVRTATIRNPLVWLGWQVFGTWMQRKFVRRACERMVRFVRYEQGMGVRRLPRRASETVTATVARDPTARRRKRAR